MISHYFPVTQRDRQWGLYVVSAGHGAHVAYDAQYMAKHPESYRFTPDSGRVIREYQLIYVSAGTGWFESVGVPRTTVMPGTLFVLFPDVWHNYSCNPDTGWTEHWIGLDGPVVHNMVKDGFFDPHFPIYPTAFEFRMLSAFNELMEIAREPDVAAPQRMAGIGHYLLSQFYASSQASQYKSTDRYQCIRRAMQIMRENPKAEFDGEAFSVQCGISYVWFRRLFTQYTGVPPHQYLMELRMALARSLLTSSNLSVKDIAIQSGFEDEHYFSRMFRKRCGTTPSSWRPSHR